MTTPATPPRIVSVDDEANILKLVLAILGDAYEVTTFSDSARALKEVEALKPDLIICDIDMPGLSGFALHESVRAISSLRAVPFIFLTGLSDRNNMRRGMMQGADDYLTKPFSPDELREAVEIRLARADNLRALDGSNFQILSMGGVGVSARGEYLQYEAKKVVELLLYLFTRSGAVPLRLVPDELWRETVGENNLHVLINRARKAFEGLAEFPVDGDMLSLELLEDFDWDAGQFEAAAEGAKMSRTYSDVERAVQLYKGSFLPGFDSPWSEQQRSFYDSLYLKMLELSAELAPSEAAKKSADTRLETFLESGI